MSSGTKLVLFTALAFCAGLAAGYVLRPLAAPHGSSSDRGRLAAEEGAPGSPAQPGRWSGSEGGPDRGGPGPGEASGPEGRGRLPGGPEELEKNPYAGKPPEELVAALRDLAAARDFRAFKLASAALGKLNPAQVEEVTEMLLALDDPKAANLLAHELVMFGGKEGLEAVARLAKTEDLSLEIRGTLLEALGNIPPERRGEALPLVADILRQGLPAKLQFHGSHIYGRLLGSEAVAGLSDLLESGGVRPEPLLQAMRDFARAEDLPKLTDLLGRVRGREGQEILLRAIGSASGSQGSRTLLEFLKNPPEGVRREDVGWALDEFVKKDDLPKLWEMLGSEGNRQVQAALARSIARTGGPEELEKLAKMASDPSSGLSPESLARALHDTAGKETVPLMMEFLKNSKTWESSEPLAHGIARVSGREGIDGLLELAAQGGSEERRRAIIQALEDFGDPSIVGKLGEMFEGEKDQGVSFHLAKAILRLDPTRGPEEIAGRLEEFPDPSQRAALVQVLEREGNPAYIPAVGKVLRSEKDERAQWQMARTLASYGAEGISTLEEILSADPDPRRRASILRGASTVRPEDLAGISRRLFREDPSGDVRAASAKILGRSRDPAVAADLRAALVTEADPWVRETIEAALKELERR